MLFTYLPESAYMIFPDSALFEEPALGLLIIRIPKIVRPVLSRSLHSRNKVVIMPSGTQKTQLLNLDGNPLEVMPLIEALVF